MKIILTILNLLIFVKLLFFWLWLWQLKEYHLGRFFAHFETQAFKKIISGFWRFKHPKFTKKIMAIILTSLFLALSLSLKGLFLSVYSLIIIVPLVFQLLTAIWRKQYLNKARERRKNFPSLLAIGITGSYGKTSTKDFLYAILAEKFGEEKILKTKEHQNSEVGITQCILNDLKPEHEIFICEMGAYNRGGIKLLCGIAKPKIGILTGINEQHMSTFGSLENIIKTKYELIEFLPKDGIAFFNANNKYCLELYNKTLVKKFLYGKNVQTAGIENIEGAKAVARELGMTEEEIEKAVGKIGNQFPGISIKKGFNGLSIIDATYSANPDGIMANLEYLKNNFDGKKIIVMPCLIELGKSSAEIHQKIGGKIGEICDLAIITTKDRFKELKEGFIGARSKDENILFMDNPREIIEKIKSFCKEGDTILLESRVPREVITLLLK